MRLDEFTDDRVTFTEAELWEMASIKPADSGLPVIMFVSSKAYVHGRHGPRIKISNVPRTFSESDNFVVSISHEPVVLAGKCKYKSSELEDIFDWIKTNYDPLTKFWNDDYESNVDFYQELKKL